MKKKINIFLLSFIFFISSLFPCISVYALGSEWTSSEKTKFFAEGFYKIVTDICGLILPTGLGGQNLQQDYQNYVLNNDWIQSNMTYDEWIASQISGAYINGSSGNADISFSADLQNSLNSWANYYIDNNMGFEYVYSFIPQDFRSSFNSETYYNRFVSLVSNDSYTIRVEYNSNSSLFNFKNDLSQLKFVRNNSNLPITASAYYDWVKIDSNRDNYNIYSYSNSNGYFINNSGYYSNTACFIDSPNNIPSTFPGYCFVTPSREQFILYRSVEAMRNDSQGVKDYYITDSFNSNTDNSINTSYTTTTSNIDNSITYGDVQNYVNNYYVENQSYPTTTVINNYITNYVPSDSGGSGGDSGGGGSNIFDFLGTIGDFLGNLIQGIGNVISGILSALTDVIDMFIGENGLPNVIGQLISYFLPFLPEWVPTVIGLSVTLALLIGIVKLIRGS